MCNALHAEPTLRWSPNLLSVCDLFSLSRPGLCRPDRLTCMQARASSSVSCSLLVQGGTRSGGSDLCFLLPPRLAIGQRRQGVLTDS